MPVQLLLAQAMIERGLLDTISTGLTSARHQLEFYVGRGNTPYVLAAAVVLVFFLTRVRRRH